MPTPLPKITFRRRNGNTTGTLWEAYAPVTEWDYINNKPTDYPPSYHTHEKLTLGDGSSHNIEYDGGSALNVVFGTDLTVSSSATGITVAVGNLAASKITSGTFDTARIPDLAASKITSGTFADARIASANTWNAKLGSSDIKALSFTTWNGTTATGVGSFTATSAGELRFNQNHFTLSAIGASQDVYVEANISGIKSAIGDASSTNSGLIKTNYTTSGTNYKLNIDSNGNGYVSVPWENTWRKQIWRNASGGAEVTLNNGTNTGDLDVYAGSNITIQNHPDHNGCVLISATDTTYESKAAASGGTALSLVTTGEKYTWNNKLSSITSLDIGVSGGQQGDTITYDGTVAKTAVFDYHLFTKTISGNSITFGLNGVTTSGASASTGYLKVTSGTLGVASSLSIDSIAYTTTAPTSAWTGGGVKVAILSSEPATKYNGWIYIITT